MLIIGCDFHPGFQQVAIFDNRTGEIQEKRLQHRAEAEQFYGALAGQEVLVGMEACGHYPWFERLLEELGFELWMGDAAKIRASVVRKQKTDRRDAEHLLQLLISLREKDHGETARCLTALREEARIDVGEIESNEEYVDFVKSPEYKAWSELRKRR